MGENVRKVLHIIIASFFTLVVIVGFLNQWYSDPYYVILLVVIAWISMVFHFTLKNYLFQGIIILFSLASGFYGFWQYSYSPYAHSILNAVYSTIRLFFLDVDPVFNAEANKYVELPLPVELARWTAAFYTISTISLLVLRYFGLSLKGEFYRHVGGHIIVMGYNDQSSVLIENLRKEKHKVSVINESFSEEEEKELFELGVPIFPYNSKGLDTILVKSGIAKSNYVILFDEDDSINLETYISIKNTFSALNGENLKVLLHLEHPKSLQVYDRMISEEEGQMKSFSFSTSQLIAEKMIIDHPLYIGYEDQLRKIDGDPLHLLFIGFGKRNQQIAFQVLNLCHFFTEEKIHFSIYDRDIEKVKKEWGYLAKNAQKLANIHFKQIDILKEDLTEELNQMDKPITHVYLSLQDDFQDMIEGLELVEPLPNVPVFIKMKDNHKVSNWLDENQTEYKLVKRYANLSEVLTSEYVLNEKLKKIAETAHQRYQKRREGQGLEQDKDWDQLNSTKQESNRYQMLHADTKLMLLGLQKVRKQDQYYSEQVLDEIEFKKHIIPYKELLSKVEHERWNAFHFLRGWSLASQDTSFTKEELEKLKLHKSLVSWEELSEPTKDYDRDSIDYLQLYYDAQEFDLVKKEEGGDLYL